MIQTLEAAVDETGKIRLAGGDSFGEKPSGVGDDFGRRLENNNDVIAA